MSLKKWKKGDILIHKHEMVGYFMLMGYKEDCKNHKGYYILSPLFGWEKILMNEVENFFVECNYKKLEKTGYMAPIVQARFDHEYMRRINKL